jgi:Spy/CpxP family protein refolding chaperone
MKKNLLMILCAGIISVTMIGDVNAKGHKNDHRPKIERMHDDLAKKLNLTDEQKEQAKLLRKKDHVEAKELFEEMDKIREKLDNLRKKNMEEFEQILTPEQKSEFEKIKEERKKHMKKKGWDRHGRKTAK